MPRIAAPNSEYWNRSLDMSDANTYHNRQGYRRMAISLLFLIMAVLLITGCATKQDVLQVSEKVTQVRNDQKLIKTRLDHLDSLITTGEQQDNRLRVSLQSSVESLTEQLTQMQNQIEDLQQLIFRISQRAGDNTAQPLAQTAPEDTATQETPPDTAATAAPSVDCRRLWDNAFKDMYRGQYDLAISGFSDYLQYCPEGDLSDNSQFWIAESYYEMKQYEKAVEEYNTLLSKYANSEKRATAYFKLGRSHEEMADTTRALEYFNVLKNEFPGSVEYEQVKDKIEAWGGSGN